MRNASLPATTVEPPDAGWLAASSRVARALVWTQISLLLVACGGGSAPGSETPIEAVILRGVLEDGKIAGATVFLDLNGNKVRDEDEPESSLSDEEGNFSLAIPKTLNLSEADLARAMLVANVPPDARDRDDNGKTLAEAGKAGFTYLAPAAAALATTPSGALRAAVQEIPVNPITSLVANEVMSGAHTNLAAAAKAVADHHTPLQGKDPFRRFTDGADPVVAAYAKALTIRLAEVRQQMVDEAKKEAATLAAEEIRQGQPVDPTETAVAAAVAQAAARAESSITNGATAREAALAAIAQVASERNVLANAVTTALSSSPVGPNSLPAAAVEKKIRESLEAQRQAEPRAPPGPQRAPEAAVRAAAAAASSRVRYIVSFRSQLPAESSQRERESIMRGPAGEAAGARVEFTYQTAIRGFAVSLPATAADAFLEAMANNPNVDRVEADAIISRQGATQLGAPWGLDRTDQPKLPLDSTFNWTRSGVGVTAYIIDTGILSTHNDFAGRVVRDGYSAISDGRGTEDCNGHGTHVAATVGGLQSGIAKSVALVPVRVLDCSGSGSLSGVIAGIDWVVARVVARAATTKSVINMSLGGAASATLDQAVAGAIASGINTVVAAGNASANACNYSPARVAEAITVGATTASDQRSAFSNFGACLDLFAPGESILSAWHTSNSATATLSGTSMASPHVAGVVAQMLETASDSSPSAISRALLAAASFGLVGNQGVDSPNRLLFSSPAASDTSPGSTEPIKVSIASLSGNTLKQRNGWVAQVTVKLKRPDGSAVAGARVGGDFSVGGKSVSCTSDASGSCVLASGVISGKVVSTTWGATAITGDSVIYDAASNTAATLTINRPR